jgi:hypothetical protein
MKQKALIYFEAEVKLRPTVNRPVCLGAALPSGAQDQIFVFCLTNEGFLDVGRPLWRKDGSLIYSYNCFWSLPEHLNSQSRVQVQQSSWPYFTVSSETPQPGRPDPRTGWPSYTPGHCVPFSSPLKDSQCYTGGILTRLRLNLLWSSVNCANIYLICTFQETHFVSTAEPNRLLLIRDRVAVYCDNHARHTNKMSGLNKEFHPVYRQ